AITQMDEVTQQNAALVEQAAAAAESLEEQAQNLAVAVATFRIDASSGSAVAVRRAPAATPARKATPAKAPAKAPARAAKAPAKASAKPADDEEWEEF
ncbi:MAG TPA: hypothetical protein VFW59_10000, partial [Gallionella sp.]|nr:hypothetical protein [Gallionella sp.]